MRRSRRDRWATLRAPAALGRALGALALAALGSCTLVVPAAAQEVRILRAALSPTEVTTGQEVTVRSLDSCSGSRGYLLWLALPGEDFSWDELDPDRGLDVDAVALGFEPLQRDGSWQVEFALSADDDEEGAGGSGGSRDPLAFANEQLSKPSDVMEVYGPLPFTLDGEPHVFIGICLDYFDTLEASLAPAQVLPDEPVTVRSIDACPEPLAGVRVYWDLWRIIDPAARDIDLRSEGYADLAEDGSWQFTLVAPPEAGSYVLFVECQLPEGELTVDFYDELYLEVTEPVRVAGAAPPSPTVPIVPTFTG